MVDVLHSRKNRTKQKRTAPDMATGIVAIKKGERSDDVMRNQSDSKMHILCKTQHAVKIRFTFSGVYDAR